MKKWIRRLRGALGIGTLWGVTGAILGAIGGALGGLLAGLPIGYPVPFLSIYVGATTFLLGAGFSFAVAAKESRGTLGRPSTGSFAQLGALAGTALPFAWMLFPFGELLTDLTALPLGHFVAVLLGASATCAVIGSGLAAGTLSIARRAPGALPGENDAELISEPISEASDEPDVGTLEGSRATAVWQRVAVATR